MRVLFFVPVFMFVGVSATFNLLFSATLGHSALERLCWIVFGIGAAVGAGLAPDMIRANLCGRSPTKAFAAFLLLLFSLAWDARCARGFADMEAQRAESETAELTRKRARAETKAKAARAALAPYADAIDPIEADAAVSALTLRTNDQRCAARTLDADAKALCEQLTAARLAATRAHAKVRRTAELEAAEQTLNATAPPPPRESLTDYIPAEVVKWFPAIVLQVGVLFGFYAAAVPAVPRNAAPPSPPAPDPRPAPPPPVLRTAEPRVLAAPVDKHRTRPPAPPTATGSHTQQVVATVARLLRDPDQCPPGLGVNGDGWLEGPQRKLATLTNLPLSILNRELKLAASTGALELDTTGGVTRMRVAATLN